MLGKKYLMDLTFTHRIGCIGETGLVLVPSGMDMFLWESLYYFLEYMFDPFLDSEYSRVLDFSLLIGQSVHFSR